MGTDCSRINNEFILPSVLNTITYKEDFKTTTVTVLTTAALIKAKTEIKCPVTVRPGQFFTCVADIPFSKDVKAQLEMADDVTGTLNAQTSWFDVPGTDL